MVSPTDIKEVSRRELEEYYTFYQSCLAVLIRRAGGTLTITMTDVEEVNRRQIIYINGEGDIASGSLTLELVTLSD